VCRRHRGSASITPAARSTSARPGRPRSTSPSIELRPSRGSLPTPSASASRSRSREGTRYGYQYEPWHWCYAAGSPASRSATPSKALLTDRRILLVVTWLIEFSLFLCVFTVSRWLAEAGADLLEMGVVGGLFSLASGAASIVGGRVADRVGHHRVMLSGLAVALVGETALLGSARGSAAYFLGYFLVGAAIGSVYPPIVAELTRGGDPVARRSGVGRTIILFCVAWNLGLIASQLAGGALFDTGPTSPLLAAALATLVALAATAYLAMRPPRREAAVATQTPADHEHRALSASFVRLAWLANLAGTFAMSMIFHLFPKLMVAMDVDPELHGLLLAFSRGVIILTYGVLYRSAFWHHSFTTMAASQLVAVAGLVVIALAPSPAWWAVGLALLAQLVGVNYFSSLYYTTTGSHDENRGAASGMHEATLAFGIAFGSILGGWTGLYWGDRSPYLLAAAAILVMLGVQAVWYGSKVRARALGPLVEAKGETGTMTTTEER
jgi:MFS family permease